MGATFPALSECCCFRHCHLVLVLIGFILRSKLIRSHDRSLDVETQGIVMAGEVARELLRE